MGTKVEVHLNGPSKVSNTLAMSGLMFGDRISPLPEPAVRPGNTVSQLVSGTGRPSSNTVLSKKYFMSTLLCDYKKKFKLFTLVELEEPVELVRMFAGFKVEIDNTGVDQEGWVVVVPEKNKERSKW